MREALEAFVLDNADLERLEDQLSEFNIFEALGAVRVEARHSNFLAFLLDPKENHGLGDIFLTRLLQRAVTGAYGSAVPVSPIDLDVWDLNDTTVSREHGNIDILLVNEPHKFVAVIENKIDTGEHSDQLQRYREWVEGEYHGFKIIYLLLSASGELPSDPAYVPLDYDLVCHLLEDIQQARGPSMAQEARMALDQYTHMLRRHIVSNSEAVELARRIYGKHKKALDFIFEYKPDLQMDIAEELMRLVCDVSDIALGRSHKSIIDFAPSSWEEIPELRVDEGPLLTFAFRNYVDRLSLALVICPGDQSVREKLFGAAKSRPEIFPGCSPTLSPQWSSIMLRTFLTKKDFADPDFDDLCAKIRKRWTAFIENDEPRIRTAIAEIQFS